MNITINVSLISLWNVASLLYAVAIEAIREYSTLSQAEVTANWLTSIQEIEKPYQDENALEAWTKVANKFRQSNGTELLHVYYRGFPHIHYAPRVHAHLHTLASLVWRRSFRR